MTNYIQSLREFVNTEYDTQKLQVYEMWHRPIAERVAEAEAIADVEVIAVDYNQARLRCRNNPSKFRPGDRLRLSAGDPFDFEHSYACELLEERGEELVVRAGYKVSFHDLRRSGGWVLDRDVVDIRHLLLGSLDQLGNGSALGQSVLSVLHLQTEPRIDPRREREGARMAQELRFDQGRRFDSSQIEAFARSYAAQKFYLVQGPPGTGKTLVLAHLAVALALEGQRVLVTALIHRAINTALRTIGKKTAFPHVFKVGQRIRARDLGWGEGTIRNYEKFEYSPYDPEGAGYIVGGTCFAVRSSRLDGVEFDTVIFDEAGQVTLPLAVAGMLAGRRYILIGDHKQMAPVIVGDHKREWVKRSVFETLFSRFPGTMLTTTYRMNSEINAFPSRAFYGGRLHPSAEARDRRLKIGGPPGKYAALLDPAHSAVFAELGHTGKGMRAEPEARVATDVVVEAIKRGVSPAEIAVVAPYRAQTRLICRKLREAGVVGVDDVVIVDTVERIQGQERDLIIFSLTTSNPAHAAQRAEFYFQPNRLNVAITRPRVKRIVIGSPRLLSAHPPDPKHRQWVAYFRELYKQSFRVPVQPEGR